MDPVTVQAEMRRQGLLRRDGYPTMELVRMVEAVPVPAATAYYARLGLTKSMAGDVRSLGKRLELLGSTPRDPDDLFGAVAEQLRSVDAVRRRWNLASGQDVPEMPPGRSREPVALKQALAERAPRRSFRPGRWRRGRRPGRTVRS